VLRVGQLGPARRDADFAATKVLNTILGGSFTSRLNLNLRERHGFTYGARSTFSLPREAGLFAVKTAVGTADTLAALREIFRELERIRARPPSREEVERARQLQLEALPATAETIEGLVDTYSTIALHDLPLDALATQPAELAAVTPACVRDLARRLLAPARMTVVVLGDVERLAPALAREHGPTLLLDEDGQPIRRRPGGSSASRARPRRRPRAARGSAG
jgi:predicted Zn-dependent peptidase